MTTEPARITAFIAGLVNAAIAVLTVIQAGGNALSASLAGLGVLAATLGGGEIVRSKVTPTALAESRAAVKLRRVDNPDA